MLFPPSFQLGLLWLASVRMDDGASPVVVAWSSVVEQQQQQQEQEQPRDGRPHTRPSRQRRALLGSATSLLLSPLCRVQSTPKPAVADDGGTRNYVYSDTWTGTALPLLTLEQATTSSSFSCCWNMARWPDPILRRAASPVRHEYFGTDTLKTACDLLQHTARLHGAVGLAAQQCGVDARIVYLQRPHHSLVMVNPVIVGRSKEPQMRVWNEECLVLPPTFVGTVCRDARVVVEYYDWKGRVQTLLSLADEAARCVQHELDHDRGILVLDHVSLEEMENEDMRAIEREGHDERMWLAYARSVDEPSRANPVRYSV